MVQFDSTMGWVETVRQEWSVIKNAPLSFLVFLIMGLTAGYYGANWYYDKQIGDLNSQLKTKDTQLSAKDGESKRLRVACGLEAASKGALVELNNQELALKTQSVVAKLRQYPAMLRAKNAVIDGQLDAKKITQNQASKAHLAAMQEVSQDFDRNLAPDAYNVENELRSRLDSSALSHVLMVPGFIANGDPRTRITFPQIFRGSAEIIMLDRLADEMEQMANLLPPDSSKP